MFANQVAKRRWGTKKPEEWGQQPQGTSTSDVKYHVDFN
jgi:hypothetical protein